MSALGGSPVYFMHRGIACSPEVISALLSGTHHRMGKDIESDPADQAASARRPSLSWKAAPFAAVDRSQALRRKFVRGRRRETSGAPAFPCLHLGADAPDAGQHRAGRRQRRAASHAWCRAGGEQLADQEIALDRRRQVELHADALSALPRDVAGDEADLGDDRPKPRRRHRKARCAGSCSMPTPDSEMSLICARRNRTAARRRPRSALRARTAPRRGGSAPATTSCRPGTA